MADLTPPPGAPEEVVTKALLRDVDLSLFGFSGTLSLITLDNGMDHTRPNTLGPQSLQSIDDAITAAEASTSAAIAITGKPFIFAAGADLSALPFVSEKSQALAIGKFGHDVFKKLGRSKKVTFAFINGLALGGGLEIGLHCNYRTLASTAFTALPECFLGIVPGWGGATLLPKLIGPERAVQVIIGNALNNNTMMKAKEALELGVVDAVFEPADFLERSCALAAGILSGSKKIERIDYTKDEASWEKAQSMGRAIVAKKYGGADIEPPRRALELIAAARTNTADQGFDAEDEVLANLVMGNPLRASLYAFNLIQKKRKKVEGAPKPAQARKVSKVGVVGAGLMASQLALLIVRNLKVPVVMTDLDQGRVDKGVAWVHGEIAKLVEKKRLNPESAQRLNGLVSGSVDQKVFASCDFIIEAVFEELSIKQKLFKDLEGIITPECVLATNTSSLSVEKMGEGLSHPERVVGFHFFNPVAVMPLLEIARTSKTDDATTATAVNVGKELKKTMIICKDAPGFVVNRLLTRFMGEVTDAIDEGTPIEVADNALRPLGFPMSPLELFGLVGPGVALHVSKTLNANLGPRYRVSPTVERLVAKNVKTFYNKDESGKLVANPEALALVEKGSSPSTAEEVRLRALKALAEEAKMMLDEGVVATPSEIDLCMLMGAGWPMHLGGILPYLDREGISDSVCGQRFHSHGVASLPA
ncbi:MAG: 3-hydroxyacyl-CoA dehydrogenase [Actinobacteria bacterium]|jgi:3-hydroxyacyl-CoA dehydrogenase/enoyl-CoA hydratase/carnithine racemase|nr:3-hydroxyacyl-CoA dehydrogenase [Actinomycetota bacterium]NCZ73443.1 3-hydroxyacyl-CoA dehydrogenase [Actinomycetota bacterium]NDB30849.1 3-hydroxyacyl-CoA dehydrogenase [Actinomycetota bacterium]NDD59723.1 3-hydroxyacyl-CoA dehydrogenase [Actinomycetota bacterium]NDE50727.1 3-hydroxyacyl-CoA dehydrogenase [Actinomycetota bacterium]